MNKKNSTTKKRLHSEEQKKRKNTENQERGTGQLKNTMKQKGNRVN
jgi:hypothetical protein